MNFNVAPTWLERATCALVMQLNKKKITISNAFISLVMIYVINILKIEYSLMKYD